MVTVDALLTALQHYNDQERWVFVRFEGGSLVTLDGLFDVEVLVRLINEIQGG